jgi:hypothetical protein
VTSENYYHECKRNNLALNRRNRLRGSVCSLLEKTRKRIRKSQFFHESVVQELHALEPIQTRLQRATLVRTEIAFCECSWFRLIGIDAVGYHF